MNRVVKYSDDLSVERTLFRSAELRDCLRFMYSREDHPFLVVLDSLGQVVNTKEHLNGTLVSDRSIR